ncbi:NAD(P)-dependent dehydrogenase (short-subunit alcohol dehydrogenase family) [Psychromicrobium silvestre]|uniref:Probable oxidoreductase n=1 Tax=Psychromicrobium silvestre TaxID=1645614 RepID=A0A7Y9LR95_9MICC|nr:SDR family NAD(P)-dependent oxidoreductase [Psychromicrobium silvestre]NYE94133.1 NAD(P)-dependent dehydrogenase (short-subunit alcohol dehydrogenase family) [Psychromicrobium silvestre]
MTNKQHKLDSGFGFSSTADEVLAGVDLSGQTALVTGGYSGLGLETTAALVKAGAQVVVPARRPEPAKEALKDLPGVEVQPMDLGDLDSVRTFAEGFLDTGRTLNLVINNAGIMACPETRVGPGWEAQFATNHLGHFALVNRLRPALAERSRVVALSSTGHFRSPIRWDDIQFTQGYDRWQAYGQAKTANALFAAHLDALGSDSGLNAFSVHPGGIFTPLQRHLSQEDQIALGWLAEDGTMSEVAAAHFKTPAQGAATSVWAATSTLLEGNGGVYCQDCDVAEPAVDSNPAIGGVKPWAVDPEEARKLWDLSAELTGVNAF